MVSVRIVPNHSFELKKYVVLDTATPRKLYTVKPRFKRVKVPYRLFLLFYKNLDLRDAPI